MSRRPQAQAASDAPTKVALLGLAIIAGVLLLALALVGGVLALFGRDDPRQASTPSHPPAPRLEVVGGADLVAVNQRGEAQLRGGPMPIDKAMALVAHRGWKDAEAQP